VPHELRVHLCKPEFALALADELARTFPEAQHRQLGHFESRLDEPKREVALAFATQVMPDCLRLEGESLNALAASIGESLTLALAEHSGPWRLHAFALRNASPGRATRLANALDGWLQKKQRRLRRTRNVDSQGPWQPGEALVQIALEEDSRALLSVALAPTRHTLRHVLSTLVQGRCELPRDPRPPSRAYQKLLQAQRHLHQSISAGETVVDLGASPGGWSFVALEQGARVIAVDRSPLRDDLMRNPRLTFVKGDAFAYRTERPVDWMICDLIAFPERTLGLLEDWLAHARCQRFVVTMKFRGNEDYPRVEAMKALLARHAGEFQLRSLDANKNEVTAMGERAGAQPDHRDGPGQ
jgi:23S rRNA (cytidine2498-2'-O)-methyltransferase